MVLSLRLLHKIVTESLKIKSSRTIQTGKLLRVKSQLLKALEFLLGRGQDFNTTYLSCVLSHTFFPTQSSVHFILVEMEILV